MVHPGSECSLAYLIPSGEERGLKRRVFIIYNGVHYDALIASDGQTVFRSDDDTPITQAIVVADQLKAVSVLYCDSGVLWFIS